MPNIKATRILTGAAILFISAGSIAYYLMNTKTNEEIQTNNILPSIKPPVTGADIEFDEYSIHPDSSMAIERNTGTLLQVPADCFRRTDGSKPSEKIQLKVREVHDPISILRAGIPMEVAGTNGHHLQSAGMIEMHAYENGQELKMNQNKSIDIELAGFRSSEGYSLYYLENNQSWKVTDTFENRENVRKKKRLAKLEKKTSLPDSSSNTDFIFSIDADTSTRPELKPFINQFWQLAEHVDEHKLNRALRQNWSLAQVKVANKRKMEYTITFTVEETGEDNKPIKQSFSILAKPIINKELSKKNQRKEFEEKMEEYTVLEKQRIEELERVKKQADLVNSFKANKMGIYNIDKIMKEDMIITNIHFDFENELKGSKDEHQVFMILEEDNSVIAIKRESWNKITIPASRKFHFIAVLPGSTIAYIAADQIQRKIALNSKEITLSSQRSSAEAYLKKNEHLTPMGN
jgi:hypothetical protein